MLPPGTLMLCPVCRVFVDATGFGISAHALVRCPWCKATARAQEYAEAAGRETCSTCEHPTAAHVQWYTPDGDAPHPANRPYSHALAAPCSICRGSGKEDCMTVNGTREVRT